MATHNIASCGAGELSSPDTEYSNDNFDTLSRLRDVNSKMLSNELNENPLMTACSAIFNNDDLQGAVMAVKGASQSPEIGARQLETGLASICDQIGLGAPEPDQAPEISVTNKHRKTFG